jgi:hypothetical protein
MNMNKGREFIYSSTGRQRIIWLTNDVMEYITKAFHGDLPAGTVMQASHSSRVDIEAGKGVWVSAPLSGKVYGATAVRLIIGKGEMGFVKVSAEEYDGMEGCARALADWTGYLSSISRNVSAIAAMV